MTRNLFLPGWTQVVLYTRSWWRSAIVLVGPLLLVLVWFWFTRAGRVDPLFLAPPEAALDRGAVLLSGEIWPDIAATLCRTLLGFTLAASLAIPLGLLLGLSVRVYRALEVVVDFFRSLPSTALFPLFLLFFGIGNLAKVAVAVFVCFWIILVSAADGVIHASKTRYRVAKILGARGWQIALRVTLWEALPHIATGLRVAFPIALIVILVTEMFIGTQGGLGQRIYDAYLTYRVAELYATLIIVGLLGYTLNKLFMLLERKFIHWTGR